MTSLTAVVISWCRDGGAISRCSRSHLRLAAVVLLVPLCLLSVAYLYRQGSLPLPRLRIDFRWSTAAESPTDGVYKTGNAFGHRQPTVGLVTGNESKPVASDRRLHRVPDSRPLRCRHFPYSVDRLTRSTTLVVQFTDYELYDAETTLTSAFHDADDVDRRTLAAVVLVDAASTLDHVRREADRYVESLTNNRRQFGRYLPPVRLIRVESDGADTKGSRWPRAAGLEAAETDVVVFVDPGVVVGRGWLAPLVDPLLTADVDQRPSAVESHLDRLRSPINLVYQATPDDMVAVPWWTLAVRMRRLPVDDQKSNSSKPASRYRSVPVLRGSAFAVRRDALDAVGGLYDEQLDVEGGGEHLELSLRLWMCGRGIKLATCSRAAVPDFDDELRVVSPLNVRRITETWFGDLKPLVYGVGGHGIKDLAAAGGDDDEPTVAVVKSTTSKRNNCKDINWYLQTVALGNMPTPWNNESTHFGILRVQSDRCARVNGSDGRIDLDVCALERAAAQLNTLFELTADRRLLSSATGLCLTVDKSNYIVTHQCLQPAHTNQTWRYNYGDLVSDLIHFCATHVTDPEPRHAGRQIAMVQECHRPHVEKQDNFKKWTFVVP